METKAVKRNFLILQSSLLLLMCTVLPDFEEILKDAVKSSFNVPDFSINYGGLLAKLVGAVGVCYALYNLIKDGVKPISVIILAGFASIIAVLSSFPFIPAWVDFITVILFIIAIVMSTKKKIGIEWTSLVSQGFYLILVATVLRLAAGFEEKFLSSVVAIVAFIIYLKALKKAGSSTDINVSGGVSKLKTAVIIGLIGAILSFIPGVSVVCPVLAIIAFVFEYLAYGMFKQSEVLGGEGRDGAGKLQLSMILLIVGAILGFILKPIGVVVDLIALFMILNGWYKILLGIESQQ